MPTVSGFASTNAVVTTGWTNPINAYADDGTYATATIAAKNTIVSSRYGGFGVAGSLPGGATINSVTVEVQYKVSTTASIARLGVQAQSPSGTNRGTQTLDTSEPAADTVITQVVPFATFGWTAADLADGTLFAVISADQGNNATSCTYSIDYVKVIVDYTAANPVLALDLDANALTGLVDLDPVATFTDQSAQANSVTQATGTSQAAYRTGQTPAGKPVLRFDGGDFYTKGSAPAQMATQEFTWFAVVNVSAFGDNRIIMVAGSSTGGREWRLYTDGKQGLIKCNTADLLIGTATRVTGTWYIVAVRYKTDGTINLYKSDGTSDGSVTSVANFVDTSADLWVGEHTGGGGKWTGDIAEIIAYNYARTDVQVTDEIAALDAKWLQATTPKTLSDSGVAADSLTVAAAVPLTQAGTGVDSLQVPASGSKTLQDAGGGADSLTVDQTRTLPDSGTGTDTLVVQGPLAPYEMGSAVPGIAIPGLAPLAAVPSVAGPSPLADAAAGTDTLSVSAAVPLSASGQAADQVQAAAQVPLVEQGQAADSVSVSVSRTLTDSAAAVDTLKVPVPQQVAGCHLWLRPEGIAALANGAGIATWPDESGFANDPVQATGTAQPTKADNAVNNLPAALFDPAASQRLRSTTADVLTAFNNVPGATMFAVCAPNLEDSTDRQVIYWSTNNVGSRRAGLVKSNPSPGNLAMSGRRLDTDAAGTVFETTAATSGVWALHCGVLDYANATASIYRNSVLEGGPTAFQTAGNTSATNSVAVGIGSSSAAVGGGFWTGHIAEIIVYNRVLTGTERDLVTNYLIAKYNLTVETPKTLADSGTGSDQLQAAAAVPLPDSAAAVEQLTVSAAVVLTDAATAADTVAAAHTLTDSGAAADQLQAAAQAVLADNGSAADSLTVAVAVPLPDVGAGADSLTVAAAVPLAQPAAGVDTATIAATLTLFDVGTSSELIQVPEANAKTFQDTAAGSDQLSPAAALTLPETATGTDTLGVQGPPPPYEIGSAVPGVAIPGLVPLAAAPSVAGPSPLADTAAGTDLLTVAAAVPLTDSAAGVDNLQVPEAGSKTLPDTGAAADTSRVAADTPLLEAGAGAEAFPVAAAATLPQSGVAADLLTVAATLTLTDQGTAADTLSVDQGTTPKTLTDTGTAADQFQITAAVLLPDQATAAEALPVSAAVLLTQQGAAADTLTVPESGAKTPLDQGQATEQLTVAAQATLTDSATAADSRLVDVPGTLADQGAGADQLLPAATVPLGDQATGADQLLAATTIPLPEGAAGVDSLVAAGIGDQKTLGDSGQAGDSLTVIQAKLLADSATGSDQLAVNVGRVLTDQGITADSLRPTALAVLTDQSTAADVLALSALAALRDNATAVDTMVILTVAYWIRTSSQEPATTTVSKEPATTGESREPALAGGSREKGTL